MWYELLDTGGGERLERLGKYVLRRPDPQIIWGKSLPESEWERADATFSEGWKTVKDMPRQWQVEFLGLTVELRLTPFKHTGVFPEQMDQWLWLEEKAKGLNVLNLFGYTGVASLVCAKAGARVTHVDGSKPTLTWARKNQQLSGLGNEPMRWILDDVLKFVEREVKRGSKYDGIIMDPPAFGHGPGGETWQFNKSMPRLLEACRKITADDPQFVLINAYAISTSAVTLKNVLEDLMGEKGKIQYGEHVIAGKLSTGIWGKWEKG